MKNIKNKLGKLGVIATLGIMALTTSGCEVILLHHLQKRERMMGARAYQYHNLPCTNKITKMGKRDGWYCIFYKDEIGILYRKLKQEKDGRFSYEIEGKTHYLDLDKVEIVD